MAFDLTKSIESLAPTLASLLGGPLAGTAVTALEGALGLAPGAGVDGITQVMQTGALTPDMVASVRAADQKHAEILAQQGFDLDKLNADHVVAMAGLDSADQIDARKNNSGRDQVWWLAASVLLTFAVIMVVVLYGCWAILSGGITVKDVSVVAAISGLIGSVVGYVAANAQTVVNFVFGGSLGSEHKTDALASSVQQAISLAGKP